MTTSLDPLLSFHEVTFGYGPTTLLEAATFDIAAGSFTALIGPNGAGKTTLLRLAAGTLHTRSGSVLLHGKPIERIPLRQVARTIALVPQQLDVPFAFTVRQVVEQGRTPYIGLFGRPSSRDRDAIDRALALTDLIHFQHRIFNELSGGERQRVKIALGLAQQPRLLLLDEPTQNLDIGRQFELLDLLHSLRDQGITILASIHELALVRNNFSSALLLSPDTGLKRGTPEEMLEPTLLETAFDCPPRHRASLIAHTDENTRSTA